MKIVTCLNRFIGRCKDCTEDYNPNHHPNNFDCPRFRPVVVLVVETVEKGVKREVFSVRRP